MAEEAEDIRHQWFIDRIDKIVWPTRFKCECAECANAYINGVKIQNRWNADGLWTTEEEANEGMTYFDTWQERNRFECEMRSISKVQIVSEINSLNHLMQTGKLRASGHKTMPKKSAKTQMRNEPCLCGSGLKFKKCCGDKSKKK